MRCYLFDLDGTLADLSHRLHHIQKQPKDWDSFFAACHLDAPIPHIVDLARSILRIGSNPAVVLVSGRSDVARTPTIDWLVRHGLPSGPLYMRTAGDHRPDHQVKLELLARIRADGLEPIMAFDDRDQVVKMWREAGIPCAQVAPGDF